MGHVLEQPPSCGLDVSAGSETTQCTTRAVCAAALHVALREIMKWFLWDSASQGLLSKAKLRTRLWKKVWMEYTLNCLIVQRGEWGFVADVAAVIIKHTVLPKFCTLPFSGWDYPMLLYLSMPELDMELCGAVSMALVGAELPPRLPSAFGNFWGCCYVPNSDFPFSSKKNVNFCLCSLSYLHPTT